MHLTDIDVSEYETLFIDRDGVINRQLQNDYVKNWDEFEFLPDVLEAFIKWAEYFKYIIVVTNQRGVGKGLMSEADLIDIHRRMTSEIEIRGGRIDQVYYCTATNDNDPMRKPNIGMAIRAKQDFPDIDFSKSLMIGDSETDMLFAANAGIRHKIRLPLR